MDMIEHYVNVGRAAAHLKGADAAKRINAMTEDLGERVSLATGFVNGLLETGEWGDAIDIAFNHPMGQFYDKRNPEFAQAVTQAAASGRENYSETKTLNTLLKNNRPDIAAGILPHMKHIEYDSLADVTTTLRRNSPEAAKPFEIRLGEMAESPDVAIHHYRNAGDEERVDEVYRSLLADAYENLGTLEWINEHDGIGKREEIYAAALQTVDTKNLLSQQHGGEKLYTLVLHAEKTGVPVEDRDRMLNIAAKAMGSHDANRIADEIGKDYRRNPEERQNEMAEVQLRWARMHTLESPWNAYSIFRQLKYEGPEVIQAVLAGLDKKTRKDRALEESQVDATHLRQAFDHVSLETKVRIADELHDNKMKTDLAKPLAAKGNIAEAYRFWFDGAGDREDADFQSWRSTIIDQELKEDNTYGIGDFYIRRGDEIGQHMIFERAFQAGKLKTAYFAAQHLPDRGAISRVRQRIVEKNPQAALRFFASPGLSAKDRDETGVQLAMDALAKKFNVPSSTLESLLSKEELVEA